MSKIIKNKIKKTVPWFLIFSLSLSTVMTSLFFNLRLDIGQVGEKVGISFMSADAAKNNATTTVRVKNAPPSFTADPAENPISSSTSPINQGDSIGFNATASDAEGNNYYLLVCSNNSEPTAVNGGAPSCHVSATQFCVSGATVSGNQASCTYNNVTSVPESQNWYAFVCDNHASEADCSAVNSGSGDSGTPLYVNHAPTITAINTTIDNIVPGGGNFQFTGTSTDSDVAGSDDTLTMYVCETNAWTIAGCTGVTLCTNTGVDVISCNWASPSPKADAAYSYYVFVKDWHNMAATNNSQTDTYTIANIAPQVSGVYLNNSNNINVAMKDQSEVTVTSSSTITDLNGCTDITAAATKATSTLFWSSIDGAYGCTADDNNCYLITNANCAVVAGSCTDATDPSLQVVCTTSFAYHAQPTDASSNSAGTYWIAAITGLDNNSAKHTATSTALVDVVTQSALNVPNASIDYTTIVAGQDTGTVSATTSVQNYGNSPIDVRLSGTDMVKGGDSIVITNQEHSLVGGFNYGAGTNATSTLPGNLEDLLCAKPTDATTVYDDVYWGIGIDPGTPSGDYSGMNTYSVALGSW